MSYFVNVKAVVVDETTINLGININENTKSHSRFRNMAYIKKQLSHIFSHFSKIK